MSFQQDNTWPAGLLTIFEHARAKHTAFENRYYGPYDKLLNYCFGNSFKYYVAPQCHPRDDSRDAVDFIVFFVVFNEDDRPVLIVEVKDDSWAQKAELRFRADKQMRYHYSLILDECPLPRLWGLSLLGTSMRIYCGGTQSYEVTPEAIPRPGPCTRVLPPTFLAGEWNLDILSEKGFAEVKEIVVDILTHSNEMWYRPVVVRWPITHSFVLWGHWHFPSFSRLAIGGNFVWILSYAIEEVSWTCPGHHSRQSACSSSFVLPISNPFCENISISEPRTSSRYALWMSSLCCIWAKEQVIYFLIRGVCLLLLPLPASTTVSGLLNSSIYSPHCQNLQIIHMRSNAPSWSLQPETRTSLSNVFQVYPNSCQYHQADFDVRNSLPECDTSDHKHRPGYCYTTSLEYLVHLQAWVDMYVSTEVYWIIARMDDMTPRKVAHSWTWWGSGIVGPGVDMMVVIRYFVIASLNILQFRVSDISSRTQEKNKGMHKCLNVIQAQSIEDSTQTSSPFLSTTWSQMVWGTSSIQGNTKHTTQIYPPLNHHQPMCQNQLTQVKDILTLA